jgi:cell wall-associated NlpC family hydrolase
MPSILDRHLNLRLTPQEKICAEAMFWLTTRYQLGSKNAEANDGAHGNRLSRTIDCSGFVVKVFATVFPKF